MHYEHIRRIAHAYDHIYLSPHLDDAALSCGGAIARHCASGARVLVVTICTGVPESKSAFSPFVQMQHTNWGLAPDNAVTDRLREDAQAMTRLGADSFWVGQLDAIYRRPEAYTNNNQLFGVPAQDDTLGPTLVQLVAGLASRSPNATFYAPLGIGFHVDHQLTYTATIISTGATVAFYEDFPYVATPGALEQRLAVLKGQFIPSTIDIDATLTRKIGAIGVYGSQLHTLFGSEAAMEHAVTTYAAELCDDHCTHAERIWLRASRDVSVVDYQI